MKETKKFKETGEFLNKSVINLMRGIGICYVFGMILVVVPKVFQMMGEVGGNVSIIWFAYLGYAVLKRHIFMKSTKFDIADGLIVVFLKYAIIVGATFGVAILSEIVRVKVNSTIGWLSFISSYIAMFFIYANPFAEKNS